MTLLTIYGMALFVKIVECGSLSAAGRMKTEDVPVAIIDCRTTLSRTWPFH
jgi:hypothetical protein